MGNIRKYNLNVNNVIGRGVGTYTANTETYSLLNYFTITYDTIPPTSYSYPQISAEELQSLPITEYNQRVEDFLKYVNIETSIDRERLLIDSTSGEVPCGSIDGEIYYCLLNSDFLVYKFLSGIRIINVGSANGIIQYRVSNNVFDSGWQIDGTILNLDENSTYEVTIRDYISELDYVVCEKTKLISMQMLIPSTTATLPSKIVKLYEIVNTSSGPAVFKMGCIKINPSELSSGQKIEITYKSDATLLGDGNSCVEITCKPNGGSNFIKYDCLTNNDVSPKTNTITLEYGDVICYNVTSVATSCGSNAFASLSLLNTNGLGTVIPTLDETSKDTSVTSIQPSLNTVVSINRTVAMQPVSQVCYVEGLINFSPSLPYNKSVVVELSAITTNSGSGSSSEMKIFCKPNGALNYTTIHTINNTQIQPQLPQFTAREGDSFCYCITTTSPYLENSSYGCLCIKNVIAGSFGINPTISSTNKCDGISLVRPGLPVAISVCRMGTDEPAPVVSGVHGFINPSVVLPENTSINVNYNSTVVSTRGESCFELWCCPNNGSNFVRISNITNLTAQQTGSFVMGYNDKICYRLFASAPQYASTSLSEFCLSSVVGSGGLSPTINTSKCCDRVNKICNPLSTTVCINRTSSSSPSPVANQVTGYITTSVPLIENSSMVLNYNSNVITSGADACFELFCRPNGGTTFNKIRCVLPTTTTKSGLIDIGYGDCVCYNLIAIAVNPDSSSSSEFFLTSVQGSGGIGPIISSTYYCDTVSKSIAPISTMVSVNRLYNGNPGPVACLVCGVIGLSTPLIEYSNMTINYNSTVASTRGDSCFELYCRPNGCTTFTRFKNITNTTTPQNGSFTLNYGDCVCYNLVATAAVFDSNSSSEFNLTSVTASPGISATINTLKCSDIATQICLPQQVVLSVCRANNNLVGPVCCADGYINPSASLGCDGYINVNFNTTLNVNNGTSCVQLSCRPNGGTTYTQISCISEQISNRTGSFVMRNGDSIYYQMYTVAPIPDSSASMEFCLNSVQGFCGVSATINASKCKDNICVSCAPLPVTFSVCRATTSQATPVTTVDGLIKPNISMPTNTCAIINLNSTITSVLPGTSCVEIWCKPNSAGVYTNIINIKDSSIVKSASFTYEYDDTICYKIIVVSPTPGSSASAEFCLTSIQGYGGIVASIDGAKYKDKESRSY